MLLLLKMNAIFGITVAKRILTGKPKTKGGLFDESETIGFQSVGISEH